MISNKRAIRGFTLIEVLVALAVLGLSLGVIMQIFSAGLDRARKTEARAIAVQLAESKLAAVGVEEPLTEGMTSGEFDNRFRWRVLVQPYEPAGGEADGDEPGGGNETKVLVRAYAVNVRVFWGGSEGGGQGDGGNDGTVSLSTIRLVKAD